MTLPNDFDTCPTGTQRRLSEKDVKIRFLESTLREVAHIAEAIGSEDISKLALDALPAQPEMNDLRIHLTRSKEDSADD